MPSKSAGVTMARRRSGDPEGDLVKRLAIAVLIGCVCAALTGCGTAVPDLKGKTVAQAAEVIATASFKLGAVTYDEKATDARGSVIAQMPAAGTKADAGSAVALTVAGPAPVPVPTLLGLDRSKAETALTGAGLVLGAVSEAYDASTTAGTVASQIPSPGVDVGKGSAVAIVLSRGPEPVAVPNVVGKTKAEATALLEAAGFGVKSQNKDDKAKRGTVVTQSPAAAKLARPGSMVSVTVSTGVDTPSDSEILTAFARDYSPYDPGHRRVLWKGRDDRGVWWAAVGLGPDEANDGYAICGYRTAHDKWVVQGIGNPDGSVMVDSGWPPMPPPEVVKAMEGHGVGIMHIN